MQKCYNFGFKLEIYPIDRVKQILRKRVQYYPPSLSEKATQNSYLLVTMQTKWVVLLYFLVFVQSQGKETTTATATYKD